MKVINHYGDEVLKVYPVYRSPTESKKGGDGIRILSGQEPTSHEG